MFCFIYISKIVQYLCFTSLYYLILQVTHLIIEKLCHPVQLYLGVNSYPQFVFLYCCQLNVMFICIIAVNGIFISQLYKCYDACMFIITISCLCNIWNCFHQCNCYFTDYCPFLALNMDRMKITAVTTHCRDIFPSL